MTRFQWLRKADIAFQTVGRAIDADVDDYGAGLDEIPGYKFRFSDCCDQNIRRAAKRCKPPGTGMGYGYCAVFVEEQMRRRQTDDLRTSDDYGV